MKNFSLDTEMMIEVNARFIAKGQDEPLTGNQYNVRLFERDFLEDDFLGDSKPDEHGVVHFRFSPAKLHDGFLDDKMPDFFFVLYKNGEVHFQSQVMENVYLDAIELYKKGTGEIIYLGTFLVDA
ncbi:hypothetical protein [Phnomibacter sp. MR]|uniref:hypothetical protein n=1 Tax=Phnomibacter sp. MR TaxID=3042318 RepID=UPI003A8057D0